MALFECRECREIVSAPRRYMFHLGEFCRCPRCGTFRLSRLKKRDQIDRMHTGILHLFERLAGGRLYHCCYCRLQFHDRRDLAPNQAQRNGGGAATAVSPQAAETVR
jgi:hypothetical protein